MSLLLGQAAVAATLLVSSHSLSRVVDISDALTFTAYRFVLIGVLCAVYLFASWSLSQTSASGPRFVPKETLPKGGWTWAILVGAAILMASATALQIDGVSRYGIGAMNIPMACFTIIASAIVGVAFLGEHLTWSQYVAIAVLLAGLCLFEVRQGK